jgi:hypothetical protein
MIPQGKTAMVWQLRLWQGGDPARQVAECRRLGLSSVTIKIADGCRLRWESGTTTNADLLERTVAALTEAGIEPYGWVWLWGRKIIFDWDKKVPVQSTPKKEAAAGVAACRKYGFRHMVVNAEASYVRHPDYAEEYTSEINDLAPDIDYSLCGYRFPTTHQPEYPILIFAPHMDAWCPQVYFLRDNRPLGGAIQLETSVDQHDSIRPLPYFPVAPTYPYKYKDAAGVVRIWRPTKAQLLALFERAKVIGCVAVSVWDLAQATEEEKDALADFHWSEPVPPIDDPIPGGGTMKVVLSDALRAHISQNTLNGYVESDKVRAYLIREEIDLPAAADRLRLRWPVTGTPIVTQRYGINPQNYKPFGLPGHEGIDIRAVGGTPLMAMADGVVARVETSAGSGAYGVHVRLQHILAGGNEFESVYAHMKLGSTKVSVGQAVAAGTVLGLADNTGNSFGAHLHITLKHKGNGSPWMGRDIVNPTPYFSALFPGNGWIVDVGGNLRSEPNVSGALIRWIAANERLQAFDIGGDGGDWWKVKTAQGQEGWYWNPGYKLHPA